MAYSRGYVSFSNDVLRVERDRSMHQAAVQNFYLTKQDPIKHCTNVHRKSTLLIHGAMRMFKHHRRGGSVSKPTSRQKLGFWQPYVNSPMIVHDVNLNTQAYTVKTSH
jgi:hypothetical protein